MATTDPKRRAPMEIPGARLVSTNLRRANGTWVRLCPRWFFTGIEARQTSIENNRFSTWGAS